MVRSILKAVWAFNPCGTYKGKTISIPKGSTSVGLFVNVDLFKQAGLKVTGIDPKERLTWDQVVDVAKKVQADKSGNKIPDVRGFAVQQYLRPALHDASVDPVQRSMRSERLARPWTDA